MALYSRCALRPRSKHPNVPVEFNDPHPHGVFDFDTNARLEPTTQAFYKFAIIPCVKNNKANFLRIRWLIPDVFGWVPPNVTKYWVPRLVKDENVFQLKGCLEYGNRGDMTYAAFLGTGEDKPSVKREETQGCRATVVRYDLPKEGLIEKLHSVSRVFSHRQLEARQHDVAKSKDRLVLRMSNQINTRVSFCIRPFATKGAKV